MKGIILAGGLGTRLSPLTKVTNKHLLPVYNKPMIYYPIECLIQAGIVDIMIVTGGQFAGDFLRLLKNGHDFGLDDIHYTYQDGEGGIADALALAEHFADGDDIVVVLGDNIFQNSIKHAVDAFRNQKFAHHAIHRRGARILLKPVGMTAASRFGIATLENDQVANIVEKPQHPSTDLAVTGVYMYDDQVFDMIRTLSPSQRNELEITDVNNKYIAAGQMSYSMVRGWWTDAGTFDSLLRASEFVKEHGANNQ